MTLTTWQYWIAWVGITVPLAALAWAAVFYVINRRREIHHQEYQKFFEITDHLGKSGGSIASKMAAAFELRKYPQYKDVVLRLCQSVSAEGGSAKMLIDELRLTAEYLESM
jgi:hypothetical protein